MWVQMSSPIDHFKYHTNIVIFQPGDILFVPGLLSDYMFALRSGTVEIYFNNILVNVVEAISIVGEEALLRRAMPHTTTAIARTEVHAVPVDYYEFLRLTQETPTFALQMLRLLEDRWHQTCGFF
jgi:CRP-like cAMP-binding protein